jgi:curli biogenesis system outer membrane secretion channel CsgG
MNSARLGAVLCASLWLVACQRTPETSEVPQAASAPASSATTTAPASPAATRGGVPDMGHTRAVKVTATGQGPTAADAVNEALRLAVIQVNGVALDTQSSRYSAAVSLVAGQDAMTLQSSGFAQELVQKAGGVISGFKVVRLGPISAAAPAAPSASGAKASGVKPVASATVFEAVIDADVLKFDAPATDGKLKIVVGPINGLASQYRVGGLTLSGEQLGDAIRAELMAALTQTGRFIVLDRENDAALDTELNLIAQGRAPSAEMVKQAQAHLADVVWIGQMGQFEYTAHRRQLDMSDRPLVSHAGGWALSHKLVHVATRQIMLSDTVQGTLPSTAPTTLPRAVDGTKLSGDMRQRLVERTVESILQRTFPVAVASVEGSQVVLSQGGQSVQLGARYQAVVMGKEIKDPQTGQTLGRMESPCCEIVVQQVQPTMAIARVENAQVDLATLPAGVVQLRARLPEPPSAVAQAASGASTVAKAPRASRKPAATEPAEVIKRNDADW